MIFFAKCSQYTFLHQKQILLSISFNSNLLEFVCYNTLKKKGSFKFLKIPALSMSVKPSKYILVDTRSYNYTLTKCGNWTKHQRKIVNNFDFTVSNEDGTSL